MDKKDTTHTKMSNESSTTKVLDNPTSTQTSTVTNSVGQIALQPNLKHLTTELQSDQKRRSSSRSIKRKRFDDEIVEYSTSFPQSRGGGDQSRTNRQRTTSQTYITQSTLPALLQPPTSQCSETSTSSGAMSSSITTPTTANSLNSTSNIVSGTSLSSTPNSAMHTLSNSERTSNLERRRPARPNNNRRTKRAGRPSSQLITKDLGRWKPIDDLALIIGVQQTNDLRMVHRGVKFSCKFTLSELQARWYALLFEPAVSRIAISAMRNLHPESIESVQRKALFSVQEEELLGTIKSSETPKLTQFEKLLDKNASIFYCARTAKSLHNHWMLLKQFNLLPDQVIKSRGDDEPLTFSDAEDQIYDADLQEQRDEALEVELTLADRHNKRKIRLLENELPRWSVLVDAVLESTAISEFDRHTLACLRGRHVRYLMRSMEITFGRLAKDSSVDVDLSLEGPSSKISRRQGTIKMRSNGDFFIMNEGKRAIFIDGIPLLQGNKTRLSNNYTVEISGLSFTFLVNYDIINAIREESAKTSNALN